MSVWLAKLWSAISPWQWDRWNTKNAPERAIKGLAHHSIPIMLLARLAVDLHRQKKWVGGGQLKNAMLRTVQAADIAGIRALVVHAKDRAAKG